MIQGRILAVSGLGGTLYNPHHFLITYILIALRPNLPQPLNATMNRFLILLSLPLALSTPVPQTIGNPIGSGCYTDPVLRVSRAAAYEVMSYLNGGSAIDTVPSPWEQCVSGAVMRVSGQKNINRYMAIYAVQWPVVETCAAGSTTGGWVEYEGFKVEITRGDC